MNRLNTVGTPYNEERRGKTVDWDAELNHLYAVGKLDPLEDKGRSMVSLRCLEYKGKTIWFSDYRGLPGDEVVKRTRDGTTHRLMLAEQGERKQLLLMDVTGVFLSDEVIRVFMNSAMMLAPCYEAVSVLGADGVKKYFLELISRMSGLRAKPFGTPQEAMDWLARQADE